ncbi:hypothetical protein A2W24_00790 [Microgenomates group bacterium RBG_16_45_19]|nr:MAG: hypothetical protein A2W24_00790 [Microgenomates group bacterium RBG_16_45_19]
MTQNPWWWRFSLIGLIILGLLLRFHHPNHFSFAFDQVQILNQAQSVTQGDLTLIGPRTGPVAMFTGPLIYYQTAVIYRFLPSVYALHLTAAITALLTSLGLIWLGRNYLPYRLSTLVILWLWATSPFLVTLDRFIWNPNWLLLAAVLSFFPLLKSPRLPSRLPDYLSLCLGGFLGYQAHFSGLLLPFLVSLIWLLSIRRHWLLPLVSWAGAVVSLLPTLIFDLRHQWFNLAGWLSLIENQDRLSRFLWWERFGHDLYITLENQLKLISLNLTPSLTLIGGALVCLIFLSLSRLKQTAKFRFNPLLPLIWLLVIILVYAFYRLPTPEYYYLIQLPALMTIVAVIFTKLHQLKLTIILVLLITIISLMALRQNYQRATHLGHLTLGEQLTLSRYLQREVQIRPLKAPRFQVPSADRPSLEYLVKDIPWQTNGARLVIVVPASDKINYQARFGLIGVQVD